MTAAANDGETLRLADVQGTILRGYRVDRARHFVLRVADAARGRAFLGSLVDGSAERPQVTTAARWERKPTWFLNLGITAAGLQALGQRVDGFPQAFRRGATDPATAALVGDVGDAAPGNWVHGLGDGARVHLILSLWTLGDPAALERASASLRAQFHGVEELGAADAAALPDNKVHFGYTDNISQPTVQGAPPTKRPLPDRQPVAPTGEFLLGYPNQNGNGATYDVEPAVLSKNSSFAAFRLLEQDVAGFERWLQAAAPKLGIDPELLAAKVCGRWRSGVPLSLSPGTGTPDPPLAPEQINDYTYVSSDPALDDTYGYRCPIGSHMRRTNPRDELVIGGGSTHRIVRRAMPYGPAYDPANPSDEPRGLVGWFINASLRDQFELIMNSWVNTATFVRSPPPVPGAPPPPDNPVRNISGQDVLLGVNDPKTSSFTLPRPPSEGGRLRVSGFGPFVTTRGGAYCYLPSITALNAIAGATA